MGRLMSNLYSKAKERIAALEAENAKLRETVERQARELDGGIRASTLARLGDRFSILEMGPWEMLDRPRPADCEGCYGVWIYDYSEVREFCGWADEWDAALNAALDAAGAPPANDSDCQRPH